jgi:hypothetical protein
MRLTLTFESASTEVAASALSAAWPPTMWTNWALFDVTQLPMKLLADAESDAAGVNKIAALTVRTSAAVVRAQGWFLPLTRMMSLEQRTGAAVATAAMTRLGARRVRIVKGVPGCCVDTGSAGPESAVRVAALVGWRAAFHL